MNGHRLYLRSLKSLSITCESSSAGRARPCQGRGREFESRLSLHKKAFHSEGLFYFGAYGKLAVRLFMANTWWIKNRIDDATFIATCERSISMMRAAAELGLHFNSFKKRAIELGCYVPNQSGKGTSKKSTAYPLAEIIEHNLHPQYQSYKLKQRLIREGVKENRCEVCAVTEWLGQPLQMELHHIDGDRTNHLLENLLMICPNCHSQTDTFRAKNRR